MKCPNCQCELELKLSSGRDLIDNKEYSLVEIMHGKVGKNLDKDYPISKENAQ